ncbi:MAG: cadmium-translocating P-type ATPase [Spirochaetales bacterium]|nr:cadmium-translocating P-type ATPase [Spirochaetales bacterium]
MSSAERSYVFRARIDCAECARKVEEYLERQSNVEKALFDFSRGRLAVTTRLSRKEIMRLAREAEDEIVFEEDSKKYVFNVEIDCAECARKVEEHLRKDEDVESALFDFSKGKLYITTTLEKGDIISLAREAEDEIVFLDEEKSYTFRVEIDCAECARNVEAALLEDEAVSNASFDFAQGRLSVTTSLSEAEIRQRCLDIEEDMKFLEGERTEKKKRKLDLRPYRIILAIVIMVLCSHFSLDYPVLLAYLIAGCDVLFRAVRNIGKGRLFDENFLMGVATIGAIALSQYMEAAAVMVFYQVGEYFQDRAVRRSRGSIAKLMDLSPEHCTLYRDGRTFIVGPEEVAVGDTIIVKAGERIALDGVVTKGESYLDTSAITGEAVKRRAAKGVEVLSGSVNTTGVLEIAVTKSYENSTTRKILDMVENSSERKADTEKFITRFARYYTPVVCLMALLLALIPPLFGFSFADSLYRALMLLVVSCPCALVLSVPLSYFASIGAFARAGVLVKGAESIQKTARLRMLAFDKTGTLTRGCFSVQKVVNLSDIDILPYLSALEKNSDHPIARAICEYSESRLSAEDAVEIPGFGIKGVIDGRTYYAVKPDFFHLKLNETGTVAVLGTDDGALGYAVISDELKSGIGNTLSDLRREGVQKLVMLTGDSRKAALEMTSSLSLDSLVPDLLPDEKVEAFERERVDGISGFVGDGINDAVLLSRADVGIAMGGIGSDAAIEAADMVIMNDDIERIVTAMRISKRTERIVRENIFLALSIKIAVIILAALGLANMWLAIFGDVGVTVLCVINAMRCLSHAER